MTNISEKVDFTEYFSRENEFLVFYTVCGVNGDEVVVNVENLVKVENSIYANLISRDFHRVSPVCFNLRQQTNSF